jgi:LysM repeat protein
MTRLALLALLLALPGLSAASELTHQVAADETLGDIAQAYYGNVARADVLRVYNGLDSSEIREGTELRIPIRDQHTVVAGDSWSVLALRYWGDASLQRKLAEHCTGRPDATLQLGETLRIGALISYRLGQGETLASISRRFYGNSAHAEELARFNRVKNPRRLQVGYRVLVPLADLAPADAVATKATVTAAVSAAPRASGSASFQKPMRRAINTYLDGRYEQALEQLEGLRPQVLARGDADQQVVLLEHLVFVYTAFDQTDSACEGYRALMQLEPELSWDRDRVSPKILDLVAGCEGG